MSKKYLWYNLSVKKVLEILKTNEQGLSDEEAKKRIAKFGPNKILREKPIAKSKIFLNQFRSPLVYILFFAGIISLILGENTDSFIIFLALIVNAIFGFWQENKSTQTLEKLKHFLKTKITVLREGKLKEVWEEEIVPGDIIVFYSGNKIPADVRLIESHNLKVSQAALTGEWLAVDKNKNKIAEDTPLAERSNMIYAGSLIERGWGKGVVVAVGQESELGKISLMIQKIKDEKTPLQKRMTRFSKTVGIFFVFICLGIFLGGILRKTDVLQMFETSVAIAVGGIPEALPITLTVILALGMERILKKGGLIKQLSSVETLGSTSVICCDKTLTLTEGKMSLTKIFSLEGNASIKKVNCLKEKKSFFLGLKTAALANQAYIENQEGNIEDWIIRGSPTDQALLRGPLEAGLRLEELTRDLILIERIEFEPTYKYQAALYQIKGKENKFILFISGEPEKLLRLSKNVVYSKGEKKIKDKEKYYFQRKITDLSNQGLRIVGLAYKKISSSSLSGFSSDKIRLLVKDLTFVGLVSLADPLRKGVKESIRLCREAGLTLVIATGDHKNTTRTLARELNYKVKDDEILTGEQLDKLSDKDLLKIVSRIKIYARLEPRHKMRIVSAWQKKGKVIAMTGDGINDAPAIKKADIGLALGSGTEVAKEAADLVLLNDSFSTIVQTIKEGRVIIDNIRKSIAYVLSDSLTSVVLVGFARVIFGWPLPILPAQILWNNFIEDTLPNLSYAFEPAEGDVMKRKPEPPHHSIFTKEMKTLIFITGLIDQFIALFFFWILWGYLGLGLDYVRTMVFGLISLDTAFVIFSYKNLRKNIWQINPFSNKFLNISSLLVFVFFALAVYLPFLQKVLHTVPLLLKDWLILIIFSLISAGLIEITKYYFISRHCTED